MGNYVASARRRGRRWGAYGGRRWAGHIDDIVSPRSQLVYNELHMKAVFKFTLI